MTILGAFLIASFILTSCGTKDAKKNGEKAGKLYCKIGGLQEEISDLSKDIGRLDWDDDDEREEIADLQKDKFKLEMKKVKLTLKIQKLRNKQWSATDHEDDVKDWREDFAKEANEYMEDNCKRADIGRMIY